MYIVVLGCSPLLSFASGELIDIAIGKKAQAAKSLGRRLQKLRGQSVTLLTQICRCTFFSETEK